MPQSLGNILVHAVFSTRDRRPLLHDAALREELHSYIGGIVARQKCDAICAGGTTDHVHVLFGLGRTCAPALVIKEMKRGSSLWLKTKSPALEEFAWQSGYGAFSVSHSQRDAVRKYIARQEEHHRAMSFQEEYRLLLKRHAIAYDERYIWE